jgi:hypothetical protein
MLGVAPLVGETAPADKVNGQQGMVIEMDRVTDHIAMRELTVRYNHAVDDCFYNKWADCFTEDGTFEVVGEGMFTLMQPATSTV